MAKDPIKKAENGTYYFRANLGYHPVTGKQIQKYRSGFSTKKEARAEYSKLILASTEELADKKEDITFKKFIEEIYLPWYKTQVKESTYKNRYSTIQKHFAYFYKKKVSEIEAINVQTWQLKLAKQFSPNYVRIVQGMLCLAFDRAIILGLAKKNPARMIGNIKSKKVKIDFWTLEEFQKVISLLYKGDYYEHYLFISFWLLFMTGMRIGEAAALQWDDIDFEAKTLSVNKTLIYSKDLSENSASYKINPPKTAKGSRVVPLTAEAVQALKMQRLQYEWLTSQIGTRKNLKPIKGFENLVFYTRMATPVSERSIVTAIKTVIRHINKSRTEDEPEFAYFSPHTFRHTFATRCFENGMLPKTLQELLGHNSLEMTMDLYTHVTEEMKRQEASKIAFIGMNPIGVKLA